MTSNLVAYTCLLLSTFVLRQLLLSRYCAKRKGYTQFCTCAVAPPPSLPASIPPSPSLPPSLNSSLPLSQSLPPSLHLSLPPPPSLPSPPQCIILHILTVSEAECPQKPSALFGHPLHHRPLDGHLELKEVHVLPVVPIESQVVPSLQEKGEQG